MILVCTIIAAVLAFALGRIQGRRQGEGSAWSSVDIETRRYRVNAPPREAGPPRVEFDPFAGPAAVDHLCTTPGCSEPSWSNGLCIAHMLDARD